MRTWLTLVLVALLAGQVRAEPTHFLIAPSVEHVAPAVERVVRREDRYWVVEKIGVAGEVSEDLDPRAQ